MNYTENFGLKMPEPAEQFNLEDWNSNTETIDSILNNEKNLREQNISELKLNLNSEISNRESGDESAKNLSNATGILSVEHGGTGADNKINAINNLLSEILTSTILKTDKILFQKINGESKTLQNIDVASFADFIYSLIEIRVNTTVPTGIIYPFAGGFDSVPSGYLPCDGREISRTEYNALFSVIGTKFGNGDEINTFNVPDLRECALVGAGENSTDTIAVHDVYTVGEFKDDQMRPHGHTRSSHNVSSEFNGLYSSYALDTGVSSNPVLKDGVTHGKQKGMNYIIKF